jgi:hypothetical protein
MQNSPELQPLNQPLTPNPDLEDDGLAPRKLDWSKATRGKYANLLAQGSNLAIIDLDLHAHFPDSESVNAALRKQLALDPSK